MLYFETIHVLLVLTILQRVVLLTVSISVVPSDRCVRFLSYLICILPFATNLLIVHGVVVYTSYSFKALNMWYEICAAALEFSKACFKFLLLRAFAICPITHSSATHLKS